MDQILKKHRSKIYDNDWNQTTLASAGTESLLQTMNKVKVQRGNTSRCD